MLYPPLLYTLCPGQAGLLFASPRLSSWAPDDAWTRLLRATSKCEQKAISASAALMCTLARMSSSPAATVSGSISPSLLAQRQSAANWLLSRGACLCELLRGVDMLSSSPEGVQPSAMAERTQPTTSL